MAPLPTSKKTSLLTARLRPIWALPGVMERMARLPVSRKDTSWVPAKTTSASDANARLSRLVAADHSQAHEHGWTELLTISLGRHAEFARSSRTITSTTSATNRAGRSGQSLHVCAPLFEDPTVSISHPTESPPRITVDPPHATPLRPLKWAQLNRDVRRPHRGFPCRLGSSQPPLPSTSQDHPLLPIPAHRRNTRDAVSWLRCLGRPVVSRHTLTSSCAGTPCRTVHTSCLAAQVGP